ncbi:MAG TPA: thiamine phosphate synthase [Rhizomicrobium sp.]|jgi:thiamine-phosphate pyrophosphorylase|nr:thiamine phosphate synthase [Rhizomicrobium sp.]
MTARTRLYLITPPRFEPRAFADVLKRALDAGDVASLQLRMKDVPDGDILRAGDVLMPIAQKYDVAFLVNDRPDLARMMRADGVHIGQEDGSYAEAREIVGKNAIVGVTAHNSRHLAMDAAEAGADYVAFGAFYPTQTKQAKTQADIELLQWWGEMMLVPVVAIGGITPANAAPLVEAGADFLAVSSGVWDHADGPAEAVRAFNALFL